MTSLSAKGAGGAAGMGEASGAGAPGPGASGADGAATGQAGQPMARSRMATPFSSRSGISSPDWNISRTMSQPPTNSPLM